MVVCGRREPGPTGAARACLHERSPSRAPCSSRACPRLTLAFHGLGARVGGRILDRSTGQLRPSASGGAQLAASRGQMTRAVGRPASDFFCPPRPRPSAQPCCRARPVRGSPPPAPRRLRLHRFALFGQPPPAACPACVPARVNCPIPPRRPRQGGLRRRSGPRLPPPPRRQLPTRLPHLSLPLINRPLPLPSTPPWPAPGCWPPWHFWRPWLHPPPHRRAWASPEATAPSRPAAPPPP